MLRTSAKSAIIVITSAALLIAAAFLTKRLISARPKPEAVVARRNVFFREGFDFNLLRGEDNQWKGPKFGERIDLTQLKGKDGTSGPDPGKKELLMVVAVDPGCKMCEVAADEMRHVRDKVALMEIPYYVVSFEPTEDSQKFFQYCDSLNLDVPAYLWAKKEQPLTSLSKMVAPSHLLLDKNGVIIRSWPGSNEDLRFRTRMAKQIADDTSVVADTLAALTQKPTLERH